MSLESPMERTSVSEANHQPRKMSANPFNPDDGGDPIPNGGGRPYFRSIGRCQKLRYSRRRTLWVAG
jgi:hypothetical protein